VAVRHDYTFSTTDSKLRIRPSYVIVSVKKECELCGELKAASVSVRVLICALKFQVYFLVQLTLLTPFSIPLSVSEVLLVYARRKSSFLGRHWKNHYP
jgi:hypothetical protein